MLPPLSAVGITRFHRPETGWTKRRQAFDRDARIKPRAAKVGGYILSHADGFIQTERAIARGCGISITTVRAALDDLWELRYLVKHRVREHGRWAGTAYAVSDQPFTEAEVAQLLPPGAESERTESERRESVRPKETTPVRETTSLQEDQPSGGAAAAATDRHQEQPMPKPNAQTEPALFEVPPPSKPVTARTNDKSAADVVAAYVDSYRAHHAGGEPLKSDKGRVARDAAALIKDGQATVTELTEAATAMGEGRYANLGMQLKIRRDQAAGRSQGGQGMSPIIPSGSPRWDAMVAAANADWRERGVV